MKKLFFLLLLLPALGWAQTPFDGTWKVQLDKTQLPKKPDEYLLKDGTYDCKTCVPKYSVKADGQPQKVEGHPYFETLVVKVVDDHNVEFDYQRSGKTTYMEKDAVSSDGKTLTQDWTDSGQPSGGPLTGTVIMTRVGKAPEGANAISGSWRTEKMNESTEAGLLYTFKGTPDGLSLSTPTGQSYTASLDGKDAPYVGDPGINSVSLRRVGDMIEETDKRDGKPVSVAKMTVSADGKTMNIVVEDKLHGTTSKFVAVKQ